MNKSLNKLDAKTALEKLFEIEHKLMDLNESKYNFLNDNAGAFSHDHVSTILSHVSSMKRSLLDKLLGSD